MNRREALAVRDEVRRFAVRWALVGVGALLASILLTVAAIPMGNAIGRSPAAGMQYAILLLGIGGVGTLASFLIPVSLVAARWSSARPLLAEASRVLADPDRSDPAWHAFEARLRVCRERVDDPAVREALDALHAGCAEQRRAAQVEPEQAERFRDTLARADEAVAGLHDSLTRPDAEALRDALARIEAHAEVEAPNRARAMRARAVRD